VSLKGESESKKSSIDACTKEEKKSILGDLATFTAYQAMYFRAQGPVSEKKSVDSVGSEVEAIKQRIKQLVTEQNKIRDVVYPKTSLSQEEQQKAWIEIAMLDAQIRALKELWAQKLVVSV